MVLVKGMLVKVRDDLSTSKRYGEPDSQYSVSGDMMKHVGRTATVTATDGAGRICHIDITGNTIWHREMLLPFDDKRSEDELFAEVLSGKMNEATYLSIMKLRKQPQKEGKE